MVTGRRKMVTGRRKVVTGRRKVAWRVELASCELRMEQSVSAPCPPHCSWRRREVVTGRKEVAPEGVDPKLEVAAVERKKSGN